MIIIKLLYTFNLTVGMKKKSLSTLLDTPVQSNVGVEIISVVFPSMFTVMLHIPDGGWAD